MDNCKNDIYYVERMIKYIDIILMYYEKMKSENKKMQANDQDSDGVAYKFNQLREEAKHLSTDFLNENEELRKQVLLMTSVRNRLIHDYDNIMFSFFDDILETDLPRMKELLLQSKKKI